MFNSEVVHKLVSMKGSEDGSVNADMTESELKSVLSLSMMELLELVLILEFP